MRKFKVILAFAFLLSLLVGLHQGVVEPAIEEVGGLIPDSSDMLDETADMAFPGRVLAFLTPYLGFLALPVMVAGAVAVCAALALAILGAVSLTRQVRHKSSPAPLNCPRCRSPVSPRSRSCPRCKKTLRESGEDSKGQLEKARQEEARGQQDPGILEPESTGTEEDTRVYRQ